MITVLAQGFCLLVIFAWVAGLVGFMWVHRQRSDESPR